MAPHPGDLPFWDVCLFYTNMLQAATKKRKEIFADFQQQVIPQQNAESWQIYRLLLPKEDETRGNYGFKEQSLSKVLVQACNLDVNVNPNANKAVNWRRGSGKSAGNFPAAMEEFLFKNHCGKEDADTTEGAEKSGARALTVAALNGKLDEIVRAGSNTAKKDILRYLMHMCTPRMMRWITALIIKDLKAGITENLVFKHLHEDAEYLYNTTMSLHAVVTQLTDRTKRLARKDLTPGQPARPMLAAVASSVEYAHSKLHGHAAVVETKFDGERMQVHLVDNEEVHWFSRQGHEHGAKSSYDVLDGVVRRQAAVGNLVLDGELIVWRPNERMFEHFGSLKSAVHSAGDGRPGDSLLDVEGGDKRMAVDPQYTIPKISELQLTYLVFDVLYYKDQSVINRPLQERQQLLRDAIRPAPPEGYPVGNMSARVVAVLPGDDFLEGPPASRICKSVDDIREALEVATRLKEEGIVVKDVTSPWKMNDRGTAWQKIKPDYVETPDIDAVIVGVHYGTGRRGGQLAEWTLGLALGSRADGKPPTEFITFCRVGTGHSDAERKAIENHLAGNLQDNKPRSVKATGSKKEKPDKWVRDVSRSVVLMVKGDVRLINSKVFAADYSMRFPTVVRTRWDKPPAEVQTHEELCQVVQQRVEADAVVRPSDGGGGRHFHHKGSARRRQAAHRSGPLPEKLTPVKRANVMDQFMPTDLSGIAVEAATLAGLTFAFCDYGKAGKAEMESMVTRLGGKVMQSYLPGPSTYQLSGGTGIKCRAARERGQDIISLKWLYECAAAGEVVPLMPRHYISISPATLESLDDVSRFCDPYYMDLTAQDVRAIVQQHTRLTDEDTAELLAASMTPQDALPAGSPAPSPAKARSPAAKRAAAEAAKADPMPILRALAAELLQGQAAESLPESPPPATAATAFLGCKAIVVQLPPPATRLRGGGAAAGSSVSHDDGAAEGTPQQPPVDIASAAADDALAACTAKRLAMQVQLHGGRISTAIDATTSHLVLLCGAACGATAASGQRAQAAPVEPAALLAAVRDQAGGIAGLRALRGGLRDGRIRLVTSRWVEGCLDAAAGGAPRQPDESFRPLLRSVADPDEMTDDAQCWPWSDFGVQPDAKAARASPAKRPTPMVKAAATKRAAALARGLGRPPRGAASGRSGGRGTNSGRGRRAHGAAASAAQPSGSQDTAASSLSESPTADASCDAAAAADSASADRPEAGAPPPAAAKRRSAAGQAADRLQRRLRRQGAGAQDAGSQLADADEDMGAAGGGASAHQRRAAHRIDDEDNDNAQEGATTAGGDGSGSGSDQQDAAAVGGARSAFGGAEGAPAKRRKVSLMDAVLGASSAADMLSSSQRPGNGATQLPTGFMSDANIGGGGSGAAANPGSLHAAPASQQRPPPALKLKDRLRAMGISASNA